MSPRLVFIIALTAAGGSLPAQSFHYSSSAPAVDRWMYAHFSPTDRETASVFGWFEGGVDTRMAQYLVGFDTASLIATNQGAANYLIRSVRLILTGAGGNTFTYDPTHDAGATYFETNEPGYQPDADDGRPIELFGAGFRNGFTAATFVQSSSAGGSAPGQRTVFAAGYATNGLLVDVSNNVGKTNVEYPHFETYPFAIGVTTNAAPGETVPGSSTFTFDLNLSDPLVRHYLQQALDSGRTRLVVSSLHFAELGGDLVYPAFNTHFGSFGGGPVLEVDGVVVRPVDSDGDGLPDDWEQFYFNSLTQDGTGDPDGDGLSNLGEFRAGTDPTDSASTLKIVSFQHDAGSTLLQFPFAASHGCVIEHSADLKTWTTIQNPALLYYPAPGLARWIDDGSQTGGPGTNRFYRIRSQ